MVLSHEFANWCGELTLVGDCDGLTLVGAVVNGSRPILEPIQRPIHRIGPHLIGPSLRIIHTLYRSLIPGPRYPRNYAVIHILNSVSILPCFYQRALHRAPGVVHEALSGSLIDGGAHERGVVRVRALVLGVVLHHRAVGALVVSEATSVT